MRGVLDIWTFFLLAEGFFGLCVIDVMLEWCLIYLLRERHHPVWVKEGSPAASLAGYIRNRFNARQFVTSGADRDCHDRVLTAYSWVYRGFNVLFICFSAVLSLSLIVFLLSSLLRSVRK